MTSHRLKWGPFPPNEVDRIAQQAGREKEGKKDGEFGTGKLTGRRPLGRPRSRWEGNIRMELEVIGVNAGN